MRVTDRQTAVRAKSLLERRWDHTTHPLPRRWVLPDRAIRDEQAIRPGGSPLDFTEQMGRLCHDVAVRCPDLSHIDTSAMLFTFTPSRNRSAYGLQARVTPMRFRNGDLTRRISSTLYQVQRYYVNGREILYLVTFCLPRFLEQTFEDKLVTVFHELYHISPSFDGDLRRHEGRYAVHSRSKRVYDEQMSILARRYLFNHPEPRHWDFLRSRTARLWRDHGGIHGVTVPRPKMVPVW
jgi:predicted metallopeptidase